MAGLDFVGAAAVCKMQYAEEVAELGALISPGYDWVPKDTKFIGEAWNIPVQNALPQGFGAGLPSAIASMSGTSYLKFVLQRKSYYGQLGVSTEALRATEGKMGAVIAVMGREIKNGIRQGILEYAMQFFGNGGGSRGVLSTASTVNTATITLTNPTDAIKFPPGIWLNAASDDGSLATVGGTNAGIYAGQLQVLGNDPDAGTVTFTQTANVGIPSLTAGTTSYFFRVSDYGNVAPGLAAWIPSVAPISTDSFFGLSRYNNPALLAGVRVTGNGRTIEESMIAAGERMITAGAAPDSGIMHPSMRANILSGQATRTMFDRTSGGPKEAQIDFVNMRLMTGSSPGGVKIIADPYAPTTNLWMLQKRDWKFRSAGAAPGLLGGGPNEGPSFWQNPNADEQTFRVGGFAITGCEAPGWQCNVVP